MREIPSRPLLRPRGVLNMSSTPSKKSNNPGPRSKARTTVAQAQQGKASALTRTAPTYAKPAEATEPAKEAMAWLHTTRFLTTAAQLHHLPALDVPEFAFVGRSNAGKSTCINMLAQQKQLAYASKTPGRTQHINLFSIGRQGATDAVLADLPGYGYAAVAKDSKLRWQRVMANYLKSRENLAAVVLLCDPRLGLTELDDILLDVIRPRVEKGLKFVILLTKADKLNKTEAAKALSIAKLQAGGGEVRMFSALNRLGVDQMALQLRAWAAEPLVRSVDAAVAADGAGTEGELDADLDADAEGDAGGGDAQDDGVAGA
jgi:GTP-binding protein